MGRELDPYEVVFMERLVALEKKEENQERKKGRKYSRMGKIAEYTRNVGRKSFPDILSRIIDIISACDCMLHVLCY